MNITAQNSAYISKGYVAPKNKNYQVASSPVSKSNVFQSGCSSLVDKYYSQLLVGKNRVAFGESEIVPPSSSNLPAVIKPKMSMLDKKIGTVMLYMSKNDIILLGSDIKIAQKKLKDSVGAIGDVIKKVYFIEDKSVKAPVAFIQDDQSILEVLNIDEDPLVLESKGKKYSIKKGESSFMLEDDKINIKGLPISAKYYSPEANEDYPTDGIKVFDFSKTDLKAISNLNVRHLEKLVQEDVDTSGQKQFTFADVGGQDDVITKLKQTIIYPMKFPSAYRNNIVKKGVILTGPPGTGKSLIAKAIANEVDANFYEVGASSLQGKYVGETEKNWRDLFQVAIDNQPSIIFIDELEGAAAERSGSDTASHDNKAVDQILKLMSDLEKSNNQVFVIGATNKLELLDPAISRPGRFGEHILVGSPDIEGCKKILAIHSKNKPVSTLFSPDEFAKKLFAEKLTGATIAQIVNDANGNAYNRLGVYAKMENGTYTDKDIESLSIETEDFEKALQDFKDQPNGETVKKSNPIGYIWPQTSKN